MKAKNILIIFSLLILIAVALYYYGFISAFRNFSGSDSWRHLKEYQLYARKQVVEQKIYELIKSNPSSMAIADSSSRLKDDGWLMISIYDPPDTITYTLRFTGNDSIWNSRGISEILLMEMSNKQFNVTYPTVKNINKKSFKKMLQVFENRFIDSLKNIRNPN